MTRRLKIAVLLSGSGTTLKNLLDKRERGLLSADIGLVISSRPGVLGIAVAKDAGIRTEIIAAKDYHNLSAREGEHIYDWKSMSREINKLLSESGFDLICMAGYLSRYLVPKEFVNRVMNIHPSLIPMFCGDGMYGRRVHEAVIESGVRVTGCTVHFADNNYDSGPIILQRVCPVYSEDTPADVAARVFIEECEAYPAAINLLADGRVTMLPTGQVWVERDKEIRRFRERRPR